jgi:hypothetical protein
MYSSSSSSSHHPPLHPTNPSSSSSSSHLILTNHNKESQTTSEDISNFEKKFFEIYQNYITELQLTIDLSQNMLILCLDHLISFCCWARRDTQHHEWIHHLLLDNPDLRPEVRNGISLIIIYIFASAKEYLESENTDMFGVLQDPLRGLGIVHKTSLRIYNDPLNYFGFIKVTQPRSLSLCLSLSASLFLSLPLSPSFTHLLSVAVVVLRLWINFCSCNPRE